jgi:hypothetical protein
MEDIAGFEGIYVVNMGRVKGLCTEKTLLILL